MRVRRSLAWGAVALVVLTVAAGGAGASAGPASTPRKVLIVSFPRLTWDGLRSTSTPNLRAFLSRAAVASMSTRTVGPRTDPSGAYLTIGAGNRADSLDPLTAGEADDVGEQTPAGTAAEVYGRRTGITPRGQIVALSIAEQQARNKALLYGAVPGSLGTALVRAGHRTAVVGNADETLTDGTHREAVLGAMGRTGQASAGEVSSSLLVEDPAAPFGVRSDPAAVRTSVDGAWSDADVLLVEMSDLERAEQARAQSTPAQGDAQFRSALRASDRLFGADGVRDAGPRHRPGVGPVADHAPGRLHDPDRHRPDDPRAVRDRPTGVDERHTRGQRGHHDPAPVPDRHDGA
jgi:hypothetical protein